MESLIQSNVAPDSVAHTRVTRGIAPAVGVTGVLVQHLERIDLNRVDARANDADVTLDAP